MKHFLISLSVTALLASMPVHAQTVEEILAQPSMSTLAPAGTRSRPVELVSPAPAPVLPETTPAQEPLPETAVIAVTASQARPLSSVIEAAYLNSPVLRAEREALRAQYEDIEQARANYRPVVTADGGVAWVGTDTKPGGNDSYTSSDASLSVTQYLYRGGRTLAQVEQQLRLSDVAAAAYDSASQDVFLAAVTAAMDIQLARITIDLTEKNRAALERQMQFAGRAFDVGELTRTDVAQANARLAGADAQLATAHADYASALARYQQYVGQDGSNVTIDAEQVLSVPETLETASATALDNHPTIRAARAAEAAAQKGVNVAEGAMLPEVYAQGKATTTNNPTSVLDRADTATLGLRASLDLYSGGATTSKIRQAKRTASEQGERISVANRAIEQQVTSAWNNYRAALSATEARKKQVSAAELARDGVYKEREVGTRTVLDTLNADAELLDAGVGLAQAKRNAVVSGYALLASMGDLTVQKQGLSPMNDEKR